MRVDSGFEDGSEITVYYDPLISKLVCWADTRNTAIQRMLRALNEYVIGGLITNISFLKIIIDNPSFRTGQFDINFLNEEFMNQYKTLADNQTTAQNERAAAIITAIIKSRSLLNNHKKNNTSNSNFWQEQLYE